MDEIWKDISGYEGVYQVSTFGNVRSLKFEPKIPKGRPTKQGYLRVVLYNNGIYDELVIHRLVAEAFIDNPSGYKTVNHIDCNKSNNTSSNLEWCTQGKNNAHSFDVGAHKHLKGKLTDSDVLSIHALSLDYSHVKLGLMFNVAPSTIHQILHGNKWRRIYGTPYKS
jgi:hypothetical protein